MKFEVAESRRLLIELKRTLETTVMQPLSEIKDEILSQKRRQDLVLQKQDIIHSMLGGEVPGLSPVLEKGDGVRKFIRSLCTTLNTEKSSIQSQKLPLHKCYTIDSCMVSTFSKLSDAATSVTGHTSA